MAGSGRWLERALGAVAPPLCICCRRPLPRAARGPGVCAACTAALERDRGRDLEEVGVEAGFAALSYTGAGRRLVAALKFSRLLVAAELGGALLAARAPARLLGGTIVPVPAAPLRRLRRGFDPAAELAAALAGAAGLEVAAKPVLARRDLRRQRGGSRQRRRSRPPAIAPAGPAPERVLLVDDVITTGATVEACARALRAAGAHRVTALALAAVPPPGRRRRGRPPGSSRGAGAPGARGMKTREPGTPTG